MQHIWDSFLQIIRQEVGTHVVDTWFKAVTLDHWDTGSKTAFLSVPNQFVGNWLRQHYIALIATHLGRLLHTQEVQVSFALQPISIIPAVATSAPSPALPSSVRTAASSLVPKNAERKGRRTAKPDALNPHYTFESFVVGPNSALAHAAAYAISHNPGNVYNPLFIYGDTGLGKTHMLHAIGNEAARRNPGCVVAYETSEQFITGFINAIKLDRADQFRTRYQKVDLLLLDDVQFFSNREQTQEMFFHLFNLLYEQKKQIVFSSDTLPHEIIGLQARLKSRLQSGLIADIQAPSFETKMAILKKKTASNAISLDDATLATLASLPVTSVRELEGFLIRISAYASLTGMHITTELANQVICQVHDKRTRGIEVDAILHAVSKHYRIPIADLKSDKRNKKIAFARQVAFYMMKKLTVSSLQTIGMCLGGRDHTTVRHAVGKISTLQKSDRELAQALKVLEKMVVSE